MKKIKTWDTVKVITWKYKGKTAKVMSIKGDEVFLEWLNIVKRAKKQQWYQDKHLSINISNVAFQDGEITTRVWFIIEDGKKIRVAKKTNNKIK